MALPLIALPWLALSGRLTVIDLIGLAAAIAVLSVVFAVAGAILANEAQPIESAAGSNVS